MKKLIVMLFAFVAFATAMNAQIMPNGKRYAGYANGAPYEIVSLGGNNFSVSINNSHPQVYYSPQLSKFYKGETKSVEPIIVRKNNGYALGWYFGIKGQSGKYYMDDESSSIVSYKKDNGWSENINVGVSSRGIYVGGSVNHRSGVSFHF